MSTKEKYWKYSLVTLILGLGALIVGELWAFVSGLLGAFTIFVLVRGQMITLTERWHWPRVLATAADADWLDDGRTGAAYQHGHFGSAADGGRH